MSIRIENSLNLGSVRADVESVSPEAIQAGLDHVLDVARDKAPLLMDFAKANDERRADPGALRRSGYTRIVDDQTGEVGFSEFYAGWQHERLDYHHDDGQAKFLEEPLATERDTVLQLMADKIREAL